MSASVERLAPAMNPLECVTWLPREELTRMAMLAYEMARRDCIPPAGQQFSESGDLWSDRRSFWVCLADNLTLLLGEHGRQVGAFDEYEGMDRLPLLQATYRQRLAEESLAELVEQVEEVEP